jgi:hypothetical protein
LASTFQQVAASARPQGCKDRLIVGEHSQYQNRNVWAVMSDTACRLDAAHTGHVEVHDHHIRLEVEAERDRLPSIGRLADYIEARRCEGCPQTVSKKWVIVGDQYA